jgi:hypothetical protein
MIEGGGMKIFTYIEGGYETFSIGFWEGMEICTWNFIYPPPPSSQLLYDRPLCDVTPVIFNETKLNILRREQITKII